MFVCTIPEHVQLNICRQFLASFHATHTADIYLLTARKEEEELNAIRVFVRVRKTRKKPHYISMHFYLSIPMRLKIIILMCPVICCVRKYTNPILTRNHRQKRLLLNQGQFASNSRESIKKGIAAAVARESGIKRVTKKTL